MFGHATSGQAPDGKIVDAPPTLSDPLGGRETLAFKSSPGPLAGGAVGSAEAVLKDRGALVRRDGAPTPSTARRCASHADRSLMATSSRQVESNTRNDAPLRRWRFALGERLERQV